jgi:hypothetical protein
MEPGSQKEWDSLLKRPSETVVIDQFNDLIMGLAMIRSLGPVIPYRAGFTFTYLSIEALMRLYRSMKLRDQLGDEHDDRLSDSVEQQDKIGGAEYSLKG